MELKWAKYYQKSLSGLLTRKNKIQGLPQETFDAEAYERKRLNLLEQIEKLFNQEEKQDEHDGTDDRDD